MRGRPGDGGRVQHRAGHHVGQVGRLHDSRWRQQRKDIAHRDVQRGMRDSEPGGTADLIAAGQIQHHGHVVDAAQVGQQFRVAGVGMPGRGQGGLVQRSRDQPVDLRA